MARRCANRSVAGGGCHKVEWWPGWTDVVRHRRISAGRQRFDPTGRCVGDEKRLPDPADRRRCRAYLSSAARRRLAPAPEIHGSTSPSSSAPSSLAGLVSNAGPPPPPPPTWVRIREAARASPAISPAPTLERASVLLAQVACWPARLSSAMRACVRGPGGRSSWISPAFDCVLVRPSRRCATLQIFNGVA
jgi:hypothetical protein